MRNWEKMYGRITFFNAARFTINIINLFNRIDDAIAYERRYSRWNAMGWIASGVWRDDWACCTWSGNEPWRGEFDSARASVL